MFGVINPLVAPFSLCVFSDSNSKHVCFFFLIMGWSMALSTLSPITCRGSRWKILVITDVLMCAHETRGYSCYMLSLQSANVFYPEMMLVGSGGAAIAMVWVCIFMSQDVSSSTAAPFLYVPFPL